MASRNPPMKRKVAAKSGAASQPEKRPRVRSFTVSVRLFAWVAELAGTREVDVQLERGACAGQVIANALRAAGLEQGFGLADSLRLAVNREYVPASHVVKPGDELALIPPVSGGAPVHVRITGDRLDTQRLHDMVVTPESGAVVVFTGVTRDVELLSYDAYEEMAQLCIERIALDLLERYKLESVAIEHRTGEVPLSDPSVVVAVSAGHRPAAFTAAREAIDRIKAEAPIWKLEVESGYRSWVRGELPSVRRI